jgi:CRP-like cAMP-binding protein
MKVKAEDLKKIQFFDSYSEEQLKAIAAFSTFRDYKVKEVLFEQYDQLSEVLVLLEGSLSLGISLGNEKRIHLGTIEKGQLFSWSAVFRPFISTAWVIAVTPARVLSVDAVKLNQKIETDCDFGFKTMSKIAQTISHRLSDTRFQLMNQLNL